MVFFLWKYEGIARSGKEWNGMERNGSDCEMGGNIDIKEWEGIIWSGREWEKSGIFL